MNSDQGRIEREDLARDDASHSGRDFLKKVAKYSVAVIGAVALGGTLASQAYAGSAKKGVSGFQSPAQMGKQISPVDKSAVSGAVQKPADASKMMQKAPLGDKLRRGGAECW
jgi:hypothetical protein